MDGPRHYQTEWSKSNRERPILYCLRVESKKMTKINFFTNQKQTHRYRKQTCSYQSESHSVVSDSLWPHGLYSLWNSRGQNTGVGSLIPSPGDLPNPGIEPRSPVFQADSWPAEPPGKPLVLLMLWSVGAHGAQETVLVPCFSQISERAIQLLAANKALATNI